MLPAPSTLEDLLDNIAARIAEAVVERLRANDMPGFVDQSTSPLGRRTHIAAVRSGRLSGQKVGRRYLARREDVDVYIAQRSGKQPQRDDSVERLAKDLGLSRK